MSRSVVRQPEAAIASVVAIPNEVPTGESSDHVHPCVSLVVVVVPQQRRAILIGIGDCLDPARRDGIEILVRVTVVLAGNEPAMQMGENPDLWVRGELQVTAAGGTRRFEYFQVVVRCQFVVVSDIEADVLLGHDRRCEVGGHGVGDAWPSPVEKPEELCGRQLTVYLPPDKRDRKVVRSPRSGTRVDHVVKQRRQLVDERRQPLCHRLRCMRCDRIEHSSRHHAGGASHTPLHNLSPC